MADECSVMAAQLAAALAAAAAPPSTVVSPLTELPDALLSACMAPLAAAGCAAAACVCVRWARLLRRAPRWRDLSFYAPLSRGGASWVTDAALAGAFAAARAAGGAVSVDLRGVASLPTALQAACAAHAATLRHVLLADTDVACGHGKLSFAARAACTNQQYLSASQLAQLAAALPACTELTANLHVDVSSPEALDALVWLSAEAPCVRLGRVRVSSPGFSIAGGALAFLGPVQPLVSHRTLHEEHAAALGALLRASATAGTLRGVFMQRLLLPERSLVLLADELEAARVNAPAAGQAAMQFVFDNCVFEDPTTDAQVAALTRLLRAADGVAAASADNCEPGSAWAAAFGAALEGGAPFAPASLSLQELSADAASLEALIRGLVAAAPSLRRLALSRSAALAPEGVAALVAALSQLRALTRLDVTGLHDLSGRRPCISDGKLSGAVDRLARDDAVLSAAVAAARSSVMDARGCDEAASAAAVAHGCNRSVGAPTTLLLGGSCLRKRTAALLRERLLPMDARPQLASCAPLTSLHITHSRFNEADVRGLLSAPCASLRALTLVTERPLSASVLSLAASALSPPDKAGVSSWPRPGALSRLASFRLHAAAFRQDAEGCIGGLEDAADKWRRVLARTVQSSEEEAGGSADAAAATTSKRKHAPPPLALLHLSADAPCAEVLALRHAPRGAHVQLRQLRRDAEFMHADEALQFAE
jgi:hypothetical protein